MLKHHIIYKDNNDWQFNLTKAEGSFLWDDKGNKLIDFTSGGNV